MLITFYDFVEEWEENCDTCVHCGDSMPISDGGSLHGEDGYTCFIRGYSDEVIDAYLEECI